MPLSQLYPFLTDLESGLPQVVRRGNHGRTGVQVRSIVAPSLRAALRRLRFLLQVGLGYIHLNRPASTFPCFETRTSSRSAPVIARYVLLEEDRHAPGVCAQHDSTDADASSAKAGRPPNKWCAQEIMSTGERGLGIGLKPCLTET